MPVPAEVAFSRYFQEHFPYVPPVRPEDPDPRLFRGRHDLVGLHPGLQEQLRRIQGTFNEALRNRKKGIPWHVDDLEFHVDFVDSRIQNALAFRYEGYAFIAITIPLIFAMSDVGLLLSRSRAVVMLMTTPPSDQEYNEIQAVLFYILTAFVIGHEWAHHVHGHAQPNGSTVFPNEILGAGSNGSIEAQVKEIAANGYSAYHVLSSLIDSSATPTLARLLKLDSETASVQDQVLFALVVVAVGAYLLMRPAPDLDQIDIYKETHPPQAARMSLFMHEATGWCGHNRPQLQAWMTTGQYQILMNVAAEATWGTSGAELWGNQDAFLKSTEGAKYFSALVEGISAYRRALGER